MTVSSSDELTRGKCAGDGWDAFNCWTEVCPSPTDISDHQSSVRAMLEGDFRRFVHRLFAGVPLNFVEQHFLISLFSGGSDEWVLKRRDGRRRSDPVQKEQRRKIADFVHMQIQGGLKRTWAYKAADDAFRGDKGHRPATAREAYREFYPEEYYGADRSDNKAR